MLSKPKVKTPAHHNRIGDIVGERDVLAYRLAKVQQRLAESASADRRRSQILEMLSDIPPLEDRQSTKVFLRRVIDHIVVRDGKIEKLVL